MIEFTVFQQLDPVKIGRDPEGDTWAAQIVHVGSVTAKNIEDAIAKARQWSRFQIFNGSKLAGFPMVQETAKAFH